MADENSVRGFWTINLGHCLTFFGGIVAALAFFLTYDHQIRDNTKDLSKFIEVQTETNRVVNDRLRNLEAIRGQYDRIDERLNWIQEWIKEQKQRTAQP